MPIVPKGPLRRLVGYMERERRGYLIGGVFTVGYSLLFQAIPLLSNVCADLESAEVTFQKLDDDPEIARAYREWDHGRRAFHQQKVRGEVRPDGWQRDYFQGRDAIGREAETDHMIKVRPPKVRFGPPPRPNS